MMLLFFLLLFQRKKLNGGVLYFILAIGIGVIVEIITSVCFKFFDRFYNTIPFYTVGVIFFVFLFFFLYFHHLLEDKRLKKINRIIIGLFLLCYFLSFFLLKDFFTSFPFSMYFAEILLFTISIYLFLRQVFNSDKILTLRSYYPFWVSVGLLVIYLGVLPLLIISRSAREIMNLNVFYTLLFIINMIGYSILIIGIFFAKNTAPEKK